MTHIFIMNVNNPMKQSYIQHIEKTVREHCKELEHKTHNSTYHRYDYTYDEIHLEHILRTIQEIAWYEIDWNVCGAFNLSLSWKEQEESCLKFLAETMGFNSNQ